MNTVQYYSTNKFLHVHVHSENEETENDDSEQKASNLTGQGVKEWNDEGTDKESGSTPLLHLPEAFQEVLHLFTLY